MSEGTKAGTVSETAREIAAEEKKLDRNETLKLFGQTSIPLSRPFSWCGKDYEQLDMNFEALTGVDMEAIDDELSAMKLNAPFPAQSRVFQRLLAARAAGVPSDMIEQLPLYDYYRVVRAAQNFLFATA